MNRRLLLIVLILLAVVVLIVGIYLMFFNKAPVDQTPTFNSAYAPFGSTATSSATSVKNTTTISSSTDSTNPDFGINASSTLIKISTAPIAGAGALSVKVGTTTVELVEYTDRSSGHVSQYNITSGLITPVTITTIPEIIDAYWSKNSEIMQYLNGNTIKTLYGSIVATTTATTTQNLIGTTLQDNIDSLAISPDNTKIFYVTKSFGNAKGILENINGTKAADIFDFPFNEWNVTWPNTSTITLTTKASANIPGYLYFLKTTGFLSKVIGNVNGLTTLTNPSLTYVLFSSSGNNTIQTGIYDIKNNRYLNTNNPTLPEKCVWSTKNTMVAYCAIPESIPSAAYPDDWYQGNVSFADNIYKIDLSSATTNLLYSLPSDQPIDATNLFLDANETHLFFTNKLDYSLWGLTLIGLPQSNLVPTTGVPF